MIQTEKKQNNIQTIPRPPIVVIMGHVDHGKTTILDWYRKTKVVESESGGITQHIGAYEVEHYSASSRQKKKITFIDTPGHEAFGKMRSRGAHVADIAVLVVAADEGVKPQTKESLEIIQKSNTPFLVALNKIDKAGANPERVKQELAQENVLVESYGGKVPAVEISAKEGRNMDELLETILLMAELEDVTYDPEKKAEGVVIETSRDSRRGITATLLIRDGVFRHGEFLAIEASTEKIKILENFRGEPITEAHASSPVRVVGFSSLPSVGSRFFSYPSRQEAESRAATQLEEKTERVPEETTSDEKRLQFNVIVKTDVAGSQEAVSDVLKKLGNKEIGITIVSAGTGDINESDIKQAQATKTVTIVGFKVKIHPSVREIARTSEVRIITSEIIYELVDEIKKHISHMLPPEIRKTVFGRVKILKWFKKEGQKQIVGGIVLEGSIKKGAIAEIKKGDADAGRGTIVQLQQNKIDTHEVPAGKEFGVMIESPAFIREGDIIEVFKEEVIKRTL